MGRPDAEVSQELASGKTGAEVATDVLSQTDLTTKQAAHGSGMDWNGL